MIFKFGIMTLKNKVAVVTGGSGGIGKVVAEVLVKNGATVIIIGKKQKKLKGVVNSFEEKGFKIDCEKCDISNVSEVSRVVIKIIALLKRIDILVNCAGVQSPIGPFVDNTFLAWEKNIKVNLLGTVLMSKKVIPYMIKRKSGYIINFAGGGATSSRPNFSAYAAAKTAIVRFTEVLADEVRRYNINVNAVSPGAVNTKMTEEVLKVGMKAGLKELTDVKRRIKEGGTSPELVANLIVFLSSAKSKGLSGRLISAVWDKWQEWDAKAIREIMKSDKYTLRRIK